MGPAPRDQSSPFASGAGVDEVEYEAELKIDGVSIDQELVWDLFTNYLEASRALNVDAVRTLAAAARRRGAWTLSIDGGSFSTGRWLIL